MHDKGTVTMRMGNSVMRVPIGHVPVGRLPIGRLSHELYQGLCADAETIKNRSLQLRRHAIDIVSDALLKAPRNEIQPTATPLADSTAATKATAHDDSMTNADVMYEKLHRPSTYRGRPIPENSTFWPRTDTLCSSYQPGSPVCTPTKPRLQCDTVTDADLADEAFQSSPESMHEQPDSAFRQQPGLPFCWGAASPVERSKRQVRCVKFDSFTRSLFHLLFCSSIPMSHQTSEQS